MVGEIEGGPGETPVVDGGVGVILGVLRENQVLNVHLATPSSRLDGSSIATCTIDFRHAPASIHVEPGDGSDGITRPGLTHHFSLGFLGFSWKIQNIHMMLRK